MQLSIFHAVAALLFFITYKVLHSQLQKRRNNVAAAARGCLPPPTLRSTNLLGTSRLKESIAATRDDRGPQFFINAIDSLGADVHTCRVPILDYTVIVTRDPENVKAVFSAGADFDISAIRASAFMPLLGQGIFTSRGEQWKHSRTLVRPQFSREQIADLELEETHVKAMMRKLPVGEKGWTETVDLQPLFFSFTLDTTTEFLYGQSVHSQAGHVGQGVLDGVAFGAHLDAAKLYVEKRGTLGRFSWLLNSKEFRAHCAAIHKTVDQFVAMRLHPDAKRSQLEDGARNKFVLVDELAKQMQDPSRLRNETLHILVAGRDTTGALLSWMFYFLARHPGVFEKLRNVVLNEFGPSVTGDVAFEKLRSCQYLQFCINEALRVASIVPLNDRSANRDTVLPRGGGPDGRSPVFVPKGGQVLMPLYAMQHRADIWGDDVEEFKPERWEGRKAGWEFVPFGGGARKCLGRKCFGIPVSEYNNILTKCAMQNNLAQPKPHI